MAKQPVHRESETPIGVYQVWHRDEYAFHQVAALKASSTLGAAEITMMGVTSDWYDAKGYPAPEGAIRPTHTGDVILAPEGTAFKVVETLHGFTFQQTDFRQLQSDLKLSKEYGEDFRMGQEEAARGESMESIRMLAKILEGKQEAQGKEPQHRGMER